jgi:hypothetical protein
MPGTPDNFSGDKVLIGPGKAYADVVVPGHGGRLIVDPATLTPDSTQNPDAYHFGYTREGTEVSVRPEVTRFFGDESPFPILSRVQQEIVAISGEILQVADFDLLEILMPTATRSTISGIDGIHFGGSGVLRYTSIAVIAPLVEDSTRVWVAHLYKAFNDQGLAARVTRTALAGSPFAFQGEAISTRPAGDQLGVLFKTLIAGS